MGRVNVIRPDGSAISVEEGQVGALERLGYRREQAPEAEARSLKRQNEEHFDSPIEKAKALGEGLLSGATAGLADFALDDEETRAREEALPGWTLAGEIGGAVGSVLLSGGSGAAGQVARLTPAAKVAAFGERVGASVAKGKIGQAAVAAGVEGGISGAGITAGKVLTDSRPDSIESFTTEVGLGALFGTGAGAAIGGAAGGLGQLGKRATARIESRVAKAADAPEWAGEPARAAKAALVQHMDEAERSLGRQAIAAKAEKDALNERLAIEQEARIISNPEVKALQSQLDEMKAVVGKTDEEIAQLVAARMDPEELAALPPARRQKVIQRQVDAFKQGATPEAVADMEAALASKMDEIASGPQVADEVVADPNATAATKAGQTPDPLSELGQLSNKAYQKEVKLEVDARRLSKVRDVLSDPEQFASLSPSRLVEVLEDWKDLASKNGLSPNYVNQIWKDFRVAAGGPADIAGLTPQDIAKVAGVPEKAWSTLDQNDVELLAAWAHMQAPKGVKPPPPTAPVTPPGEPGLASKTVGKAFRYLAGKASRKVLGGGFGAYMLGWNAADAAWGGKLGAMMRGAREHVSQRIDRSLAKLSRLEKAQAPAAAAGVAAGRLAPEEYAEASREIHRLAGAGGREALYMATAHLRTVDPDLADKVVEDGMRRVTYLAKILPKPPPSGLFPNTRWAPSRIDMAKTAQAFEVAQNPAYACELMAEGRLTPQAAECFRQTSPALYEKVARSLVEYASVTPDASPMVQRQISVMLGIPTTTLQTYTAQLQAHFGENAPEPGPAVTAKAPPSMPTQAQSLTER